MTAVILTPYDQAEVISITARAKRRGRPKGTDYRRIDAPLHEEMRRLIDERVVPTLTAAARSVAGRAYGGANTELESKITRLVRSYPFNR